MRIDLLLAERKRVADALAVCFKAIGELTVAVDATDDQVERAKLNLALENRAAEVEFLSETLLRIDVSLSAAKARGSD
jgi:hypothetical protein